MGWLDCQGVRWVVWSSSCGSTWERQMHQHLLGDASSSWKHLITGWQTRHIPMPYWSPRPGEANPLSWPTGWPGWPIHTAPRWYLYPSASVSAPRSKRLPWPSWEGFCAICTEREPTCHAMPRGGWPIGIYLREDHTTDAPLLIVLDGADEAIGWTLGRDLHFPLEPGCGIKLLVSARELADCNATGWLQRLEWQGLGVVPMTLPLLDLASVADVLRQMGFPLDRLGARVDIVAQTLSPK